MKSDMQNIIDEKCSEFSKSYLAEEILYIISKAIQRYDKTAFYGGGKALREIEKIRFFSEIHYVIDKEKISDERYLSPENILEENVNCIIVLPWYSRSEIRYNLYKLGYEGEIIDIYECLKKNNICLAQPWYNYPNQTKEKKCSDITEYDVEFYLIDAFEIFQFQYLYHKLLENGIRAGFVAEPNNINMSKDWFDFDTAMTILEEKEYHYSILCNPNVQYAITTQTCEILDKYNNTKIRYSYGNNMNRKAMSNSEKVVWGFDYSLVAGSWRKNVLSKYITTQKIICMGYPKYIDYFKYGIDRDIVIKELGINTEKEILVYLPTWGEWSSIECFSEKIELLKKDYFVITKPHHCTARLDSEKNNLRLIKKCSNIVLDGNYDFAKVITIGDVFICDALSGSATETVYLKQDAKVLFVNVSDNSLLFSDIYDLAKVINDPDELLYELHSDIEIPKTRFKKLEEIFGNENTTLPDEVVNIFRRG